MVIDTTNPVYQQYLNGYNNLVDLMKPRLTLFAKLPESKQRLWLQRDPLFRKILKNSLKVAEWAEQFKEDVKDD